MRLARYVLFELAVGATLLAGAGTGAYHAARELRHLVREAHASESAASATRAAPRALPGLPETPRPRPSTSGYFLGVKDEILMAPLLVGEVTRVKFNRGGSSLSLRLDFADGSRAAFKPDQTNFQTIPRKEIAAYRMNRLLGLEAVAPAVGRAFTLEELIEKVDPGSRDQIPRLRLEAILSPDGSVNGELSWWIPIITDAQIDGLRLDAPEGIAAWRRYLSVASAEPYDARGLLPQISNMVLFDYLTNNVDRFSGSNAKTSPDGRILFFMDNTLAFGAQETPTKTRAYLEKVQKVSKSLVKRIRALDEATLRATMGASGPYSEVLHADEIAGVLFRREQLLAYVDALCAEHGEAAILVFP